MIQNFSLAVAKLNGLKVAFLVQKFKIIQLVGLAVFFSAIL